MSSIFACICPAILRCSKRATEGISEEDATPRLYLSGTSHDDNAAHWPYLLADSKL